MSLVIWFTGLSGSGKTTLAKKLSEILKNEGYKVEVLDGDWIRKTINFDLGFTKEDRRKNLIRSAWIARLLARNGIIVICSFITPYEDIRKEIREIIEKEAKFLLVYVKCSIEKCIERDPKGLYKKALRGEIKNFTGIDSPFEEPKRPDLTLDTEVNSIEENLKRLYSFVKKYL